jgi:HEAT repeat protein
LIPLAFVAAMLGCDAPPESGEPASSSAPVASKEADVSQSELAAWIKRLKVEGPRSSKSRLSEPAQALVAAGRPAAEALFELVQTRYPSGDETACVYASEVLIAMGRVAVPVVQVGLRHESAFVRIDAAAILGAIYRNAGETDGQAESVDVLAAALEHQNPFVHELAIVALDDFGPAAARAVPQLVRAADEPRLRYGAIVTLGNVGPAAKSAIDVLNEATHDRDVSIRQAATAALEKINR